jgi:hypothetical protein
VDAVAQQRDEFQRISLLGFLGHQRRKCRRLPAKPSQPTWTPPTGVAVGS